MHQHRLSALHEEAKQREVEMNLTEAARKMHALKSNLEQHIKQSKTVEEEYRREIRDCQQILSFSEYGLDQEKIAIAEKIIFVRGKLDKAGDEAKGVISDAVKQLSLGCPNNQYNGDLWRFGFGTKDYAGWHGQRSDHEYGYGPKHGYIIFQVGIQPDVRKERNQSELTEEEVEASIYYLLNLAKIQEAKDRASSDAAA